MKAIIIEDEKLTAERLLNLIKRNFAEIQIVAILNSVNDSVKWLNSNPSPNLIFMDIELGDGTSFDILDNYNSNSSIIFTTAYNEYAVKAFKYNSVDYLLKPIDESELKNAVEKIKSLSVPKDEVTFSIDELKRYFKKEYRSRFLVKTGEQMFPISTDNIAYFYSEDGYSFIKLNNNKKHIIDYSLDEIIQQLDPKHFFRLNRKYICSLKAINSIVPHFNGRLLVNLVPQKDSEPIMVSRERAKSFKFWLNK